MSKDSMEKEPIISQWHKSKEIEDKKIAGGFVSVFTGKGEGVRRKVFESEEGRRKMYVYKEVANLKEAKETMQIYAIFKEANLPVVNFAKIIKKKVKDMDEFIIAMEDLTQGGTLEVSERLRSDIPEHLKEQMVQALAVIHNNDVYDYHPGLSFALREKKRNHESSGVIDFKIIDYANFETRKQLEFDECREFKFEGNQRKPSFDEECKRDLRTLLKGITLADDIFREHLVNLYWQLRNSGVKRIE